MNLTTSQAMSAFLEDITVTDYQKTSIIQGRKTTVETNLKTAFPSTSNLPFSRGVLMGSAAKGTIVRPIDDVDVLAIFDNVNNAWGKYRYDSKAFIYRIRSAYDGLETAEVGARGQAVRVFFQTGGHVDVAPVFSYGRDVYGLPDGSGGWIHTAPTVATSWFTTRNAGLGYNLAPVVRLLKKWNGAHSKRLRSFHLETMTGKVFKTLGSGRQNALLRLFEWAPGWIDVSDPGGQSGLLSGYLNYAVRQEVTQSFNAAADRAAKAIEAESRADHEEAKRLWRIILGDTFPN